MRIVSNQYPGAMGECKQVYVLGVLKIPSIGQHGNDLPWTLTQGNQQASRDHERAAGSQSLAIVACEDVALGKGIPSGLVSMHLRLPEAACSL